LLGHGGSLPSAVHRHSALMLGLRAGVGTAGSVWRGVDRLSNLPLCCGRRLMPFADRLGNGQFSTLTTPVRASSQALNSLLFLCAKVSHIATKPCQILACEGLGRYLDLLHVERVG
jgi:hypothetical protein